MSWLSEYRVLDNKYFSRNNNNRPMVLLLLPLLIIIRSTHVLQYMVKLSRSPFLLRFGHGPILEQINLQQSQAKPYGICTRVIYLTQTHLFVEHLTEMQLVPFLKSLVLLGLGWVRTLYLPNSKWTLYHYTKGPY